MVLPIKTTNTVSFYNMSEMILPVPKLYRSITQVSGRRSFRKAAPRRPTTSPCTCRAVAPAHVPPVWSIDLDCEDIMIRLRDTERLWNCLGSPLTPEERQSLLCCLDSARLGVDSCLVEGLPALHDHLLAYLGAAATSQTDDLELVEGAMLLVEQLSLAMGTVLQPEGLQGRRFSGKWQMLVTTGGGWPYGRLQYVPIIELLEVSEGGEMLRLESKAGPLYTASTGVITWLKEPNYLHYHVNDFRVELLGGSLSVPALAATAPDNDLLVFAVSQSSLPGTASAGVGMEGVEESSAGEHGRRAFGSPVPATAVARSSLGSLTLMSRPV